MGELVHDRSIVEAVPDVVLQPLSRHRLMDALERARIVYTVDLRRDITGAWDGGSIRFEVSGKDNTMLSVTGCWDGWLHGDRRAELLETCNTWNEEMFFPAAYVVEDEDGDQRIFANHTVDYGFGVTDEQLFQHIDCAVAVIRLLFARLGEQYPGALEP